MPKSSAKAKKRKNTSNLHRERGKDGKFISKTNPEPRSVRERLADYDTLSEKAIAILAEDLYAPNKADRREAAKLIAKLNPKQQPKHILSPKAREIVEFWVKNRVLVVQEDEEE